MKWHTHTHDKCRTRERWLEKKSGENNSGTEANVAEDNADFEPTPGTDAPPAGTATPPENSSDVQTLLAFAINLVTGNDVLRDQIAEALNASTNL